MNDLRNLAGQPAAEGPLIDVEALVAAYYERGDYSKPEHQVSFGTSGHRGTSLNGSFNEDHVRAISLALCDHREREGIDGPLFLGWDTHALSAPAFDTALAVFLARGVRVLVDSQSRPTPTPALSRAILAENRAAASMADGVVLTPSHNPPEDGGYKYNPPSGGPADTQVTSWVEGRANELLLNESDSWLGSPLSEVDGEAYDYCGAYVDGLSSVIDLDAIAAAGLSIAVDPLGGASLPYWAQIERTYGLGLHIVNPVLDPTFRFMNRDWDGQIRMDCSSPYAMSSLLAQSGGYDMAFGNDADADRHGIISGADLMPPNSFLVAAAHYLFGHRPRWPSRAGIGKTVVTTALLNRVALAAGRSVFETPVGFKWFVDGLLDSTLGFAGEESAGAAILQMDGKPWTTDKDGIVMCLVAAEMRAVTGKRPDELYAALAPEFGHSYYRREDRPASGDDKGRLAALDLDATEFAGAPVISVTRRAPGGGPDFGGLKVQTEDGWFAARPSGTEAILKLYAESSVSDEHLRRLFADGDSLLKGS